MGGVMLQCPVHGVVGVEGVIGGNASVNMRGNLITCPRPGCGRQGRILDGDYVFRDDIGLPTLFTPSPAERIRLRNILQWAEEKLADDLVDHSDVAASLERGLRKEAPAVAGWLDKLGGAKSMGIATWVMLLLMIYQIVTQGQGVSAEDLQRAVEDGLRQSQEQQQTTPAPVELPIVPTQNEPPTNGAD